jgi:hypothetical protein
LFLILYFGIGFDFGFAFGFDYFGFGFDFGFESNWIMFWFGVDLHLAVSVLFFFLLFVVNYFGSVFSFAFPCCDLCSSSFLTCQLRALFGHPPLPRAGR